MGNKCVYARKQMCVERWVFAGMQSVPCSRACYFYLRKSTKSSIPWRRSAHALHALLLCGRAGAVRDGLSSHENHGYDHARRRWIELEHVRVVVEERDAAPGVMDAGKLALRDNTRQAPMHLVCRGRLRKHGGERRAVAVEAEPIHATKIFPKWEQV